MSTERFILNDKYLVDPTVNVVRDVELNEAIRLEPRVMALLCQLAEQAGQLVPRDRLVKTIWDDYGGADEALTQAISMLRKVLQDASKKVIETIPKKGYVLHAFVTTVDGRYGSQKETRRMESKRWLVYGALPLLVGGVVLWFTVNRSASSQPYRGSTPRRIAVPFNQVSQPTKDTYFNTITTVGPDSTRYKLILEGDSRPAFYINDCLLTPDEMEKHTGLIRQLAGRLAQRQRESVE